MIAICVLHALPAGYYADFYPINGTFQNFNPVRRLLNGQIPYSDFTDYLGIGHLYLGSFATIIFGLVGGGGLSRESGRLFFSYIFSSWYDFLRHRKGRDAGRERNFS